MIQRLGSSSQAANHSSNSWQSRLVWLALAMWLLVVSSLVSGLMVKHWVPLPHPKTGEVIATNTLVDCEWQAIHFLYADCPCSQRVLRHVIGRSPISGVVERIVLIGGDLATVRGVSKEGFVVEAISAEELRRKYDVESAPLLMVADQHGKIAYSGGYTLRKQGLDIQDQEIIKRIAAGRNVESLPLYGCAVSAQLQELLSLYPTAWKRQE